MEHTAIERSKIAVILKSLIISYIITGIILLIVAFLLFKFELNESKVSIGIILAYLVSCFSGGWLTGKGSGSRKFMWGLVVGFAYFAVLLLISLIAKHGIQTAPTQLATTLALCLGGGMLGGMLS